MWRGLCLPLQTSTILSDIQVGTQTTISHGFRLSSGCDSTWSKGTHGQTFPLIPTCFGAFPRRRWIQFENLPHPSKDYSGNWSCSAARRHTMSPPPPSTHHRGLTNQLRLISVSRVCRERNFSGRNVVQSYCGCRAFMDQTATRSTGSEKAASALHESM